MGWWSTNKAGHSFASEPDNEPEMLWGDSVADIMGDAIDEIVVAFKEEWDRPPTKDEIISGVLFHINVWE